MEVVYCPHFQGWFLDYNMDSQQQADPVSLPNELSPPSSNLYLTVSYPIKNDNRSTRWKSTKSARSQIQMVDPNDLELPLKRVSSIARETYEFPSSEVQRLKEEVRSSHAVGKSLVYSTHVQHSIHSRGISIIDENQQIYQPIQFTPFVAWLLLIFSSISNAIVPCWMTVDVHCEGLTRSAWRIFITSLLLIPFVLYQQRHVKLPTQKFLHLLSRQNLQKHYISSLNYSVWVLFGTLALKLTARSHSFSFLRLKFFFITIRKFLRGDDYYQSEMAGTFLVVIGALMIMWDSYSLPVQSNPLAFYLGYSPLSRFCGDLFSILGSLAILFFESNYQAPKSPRFSNLFLNSLCLCINLVIMGYFFGGNEFSFNPNRGVFGLFTRQNFVSVFYVSIMLGLNLIMSNILVDKIFSGFIRSVTSCFQPIITISIYHIFSIEVLTPGMACLGLAFVVPGMMLIVGGQNYMQKEEIKINFLIYKEEEKQFIDLAKHHFHSKLSKISQVQGEDEEEEDEGQYNDNGSFSEGEEGSPTPDKQKYD